MRTTELSTRPNDTTRAPPIAAPAAEAGTMLTSPLGPKPNTVTLASGLDAMSVTTDAEPIHHREMSQTISPWPTPTKNKQLSLAGLAAPASGSSRAGPGGGELNASPPHPGDSLPPELWQHIAALAEPECFAKGKHYGWSCRNSEKEYRLEIKGVSALMSTWRAAREALLADTSYWHFCQYNRKTLAMQNKVRTNIDPYPGCTGLGPSSSISRLERYLEHPRSSLNLFFLKEFLIDDGWRHQHWTLDDHFSPYEYRDKKRLAAQVELICTAHPPLDEDRMVRLFDELSGRKAPIQKLEFRYCHGITPRMLEAITQFPKLQSLVFRCTDLSDEGFAVIGRHAQLKQLSILKGSKVSAAGLANLEPMRNLSKLEIEGSLKYPNGEEALPAQLACFARKLPGLDRVEFFDMGGDKYPSVFMGGYNTIGGKKSELSDHLYLRDTREYPSVFI